MNYFGRNLTYFGFIFSLTHITRVLLGLALILKYLCTCVTCVWGICQDRGQDYHLSLWWSDLLYTGHFGLRNNPNTNFVSFCRWKPLSAWEVFPFNSKLHPVFRAQIKFHLLREAFPLWWPLCLLNALSTGCIQLSLWCSGLPPSSCPLTSCYSKWKLADKAPDKHNLQGSDSRDTEKSRRKTRTGSQSIQT